ncbi:hypothetical protein HUU40_00025 [candidate division KSB1 bacterium]|nr:hypothetical protein [candidate division KSB1 bacterium]
MLRMKIRKLCRKMRNHVENDDFTAALRVVEKMRNVIETGRDAKREKIADKKMINEIEVDHVLFGFNSVDENAPIGCKVALVVGFECDDFIYHIYEKTERGWEEFPYMADTEKVE